MKDIPDYNILAVAPTDNECFYIFYIEPGQTEIKHTYLSWKDVSNEMLALWPVCKAAHDSLRNETIAELVRQEKAVR